MVPLLLELHSQHGTEGQSNDAIERRVGKELSYSDFYWTYLHNNWPVLLTGVSNEWECRCNWTQTKKESKKQDTTTENITTTAINFDYLRERMSNNWSVPVADCSREYFNSHAKSEMRFEQFLEYWQRRIKQRQAAAMNCNVTEDLATTTNTESSDSNLYLKDWHLRSQMSDYEFYQVPPHFAADWLNEQLLSNGQDDYRFVYMGPEDTWTSFHADVFGSYSWSTNIVGCKKWLMLPPGEELKLANNLGALPFRIDETLLEAQQVRYFTVLQRENEALFVPSGWHHQVCNLSDTISVNHNWFNGCNVLRIWQNLATNMRQVLVEIDDCRQMDNFEDHCQLVLRASFGLNYCDFLDLLEGVVERRLKCLKSRTALILFDTYCLNDLHLRHDLQRVHTVVVAMMEDDVISNSRAILYRRCVQLAQLLTAENIGN